MASNLYETLDIDPDASPEQIRKAYKKRALATHPDRFVSGSAVEKSFAEEQFRKVNNAYEVLNDPEKRKVYDEHGIWPPPEFETFEAYEPPRRSRRHSHSHHRHRDPFPEFSSNFHGFPGMRGGFGGGNSSFPRHHPFTDPFVLFNSMFGDLHRHFDDPFPNFPQPHHGGFEGPRPGRHEPFERFDMPGPGPGPGPMLGFSFGPSGGMGFDGIPPGRFRGESRSFGIGGGRNWRSESRVTTSLNGVTQSTWTRVDSDGNEHITHTYPDGREVYRVNGIEQPQNRDINERYIPPPPPEMRADGFPPPPLITGPPHFRPGHHRTHSHEGHYNSAGVHPDEDWDMDRDHGYGGERESKRRWWHAGRR